MSSQEASVGKIADQALSDIADYVKNYQITSPETYRIARYCVMDALGCAMESLNFPECTKLLGPIMPGTLFPNGVRVPGTQFELDPMSAAFNIGVMIRWLDFSDTFTAAQGGHPSDNIGCILATADYLSRKRLSEGKPPLKMREVLTAVVKAYEIQGILSLENGFSHLGYDSTLTVKVASTAVVTGMLGGTREEIINAVSNAFVDGVTLKIFRQGADTGSRKSWQGPYVASHAIWFGLMALKGEMGYPSALTAKKYGVHDVLLKGEPLKFSRPYGSYVIENVKFKLVAVGMYGQSAVECAFKLYPQVRDRLEEIDLVTISSESNLMKVMNKQGPLTNPADRDHCVQYGVAVALLHGKLGAADFEDEFAADPRIDALRAKMTVVEDPRYTRDYHDPQKRSNANAMEIRFKDGTSTPKIEVEYTSGHPRRRAEALPMLEVKFRKHLEHRFPRKQQEAILDLLLDQARLEATPVNEFMQRFVI